MNHHQSSLNIHGIVPPMVTPLRDQDELDAAGLERLIEHLLAGGVHGLFVLGTTGEGPSLSYRLRRELVERTCKKVRGRVPVLVGITDTAFTESCALADHAAECGAAALVLAPPYYFQAGQPELLEYLGHVSKRVALPLVLYNLPGKISYEVDTVRRAADLPGIIGLKDSSGSRDNFYQLKSALSDRGDFSLLTGSEELLAEVLLSGAQGGVCGGANVFPKLYVALYNAIREGNELRMQQLNQIILEVGRALYGVGDYGSSSIKGIKCALFCKGICEDFLAEPFHRFHEAERQQIARAVADLEFSHPMLV